MNYPRIVLAGANSGSGKTTVAAGIMAALVARGFTAAPFKAGPDYLDPALHSAAARRPCRNLDTMLLPRNALLELFSRAAYGADVAVVEGVMGLFDGAGALDERGSTAHLAKTLAAPVVLVVNGKAMARSAAALVMGFARFDRKVPVKGVIFNNLGSPGHYSILKEATEAETGIPVLGYIPRDEAVSVPERRLGLRPPEEQADLLRLMERLGTLAEAHLDLDGLMNLARGAPKLPAFKAALFASPAAVRVPIALAVDEAFSFYYQDNLDILEHLGADLIPFSPLRDKGLPKGTAGLYIGGGFPEEFAPGLASNASLIRAVGEKAAAGLPIFAEGGGLPYLTEGLEDKDGKVHPMAGVFPGTVRLADRRQALGYHSGRFIRTVLAGRKGALLKGRLFHWYQYDSQGNENLFSLRGEKNGRPFQDGLAWKKTFASFLHIHFGTNLSPARRFVVEAVRWAKG